MDYVSFGSITVPTKWLLLAVAFLISYLLLKLRKKPAFSAIVFDAISNSLFMGILVLKLSLLLLEPSLIIKNPMSLLYFTGGDLGYWLAVCIALLTFLWETKKNGLQFELSIKALFSYILYTILIYHGAQLFFNPGWDHALNLLFAAFVFVWLFVAKKGFSYYPLLVGFALFQLVLTNLFGGTSYEYIFYSLLIVVLLLFKKQFNF